MASHVLTLSEIGRSQVDLVGGKGAHLGELSRIGGVRVPAGFCVTTDAFRRIMADAASLAEPLASLATLHPDDREGIGALSARVRATIEDAAVPGDLAEAITAAVATVGDDVPCAVRSSATAEDLPTASFAGQQDSYLNVVGAPAILDHVRRCWASLFTERAVAYRLRHGIDHRSVHMAVVVQQMVFPDAAGVLFTADPVTGNRKVAVVEAVLGLGDALVSGLVNADRYTVRDGVVVDRAIGDQTVAVRARPGGGTQAVAIDPATRGRPVLTDAQARRVVEVGRRIEAHVGHPQDVEWCLADDDVAIVQARPITTLFPVPLADDGENHVYVSVGHQQMMTDPFTPLGLSFWQQTTPRPMAVAGGRLFVDVTPMLASPASRDGLVDTLGRSDPLIGDALRTILDRDGFVRPVADAGPAWTPPGSDAPAPIDADPAIVEELIDQSQETIAAARRALGTLTGPALIDAIVANMQELKAAQFRPRSLHVIMAGMEAAWWLNDRVQAWLGEKNVADTLTQSVPHNVTAAMGLALLDVADAVRPHPEVVAFLEHVEDDDFLDELPKLPGGAEAAAAIRSFLDTYGMRCVGEIDITRPRWRERPTTLVPLILANVRNFEAGAARRRFEEGRAQAEAKAAEILERLRALPDGEAKAAEAKGMIDRVRTFSGYREYPKYAMISRYLVYKEAVLAEARRLVDAGVLGDEEDVFYLTLEELGAVVAEHHVDGELIRRRREEFTAYRALTPPRVFTSDGEVVTGAYGRDDVPPGALPGLPVSAGTVEGRARVVLDMADADLEPGDILVTAYTDPSWTPLFVTIAGLVTEVGGLMTHGAVIAREYGLPAVVGVEGATRLIPDGSRVRVHGTDGHVEVLP